MIAGRGSPEVRSSGRAGIHVTTSGPAVAIRTVSWEAPRSASALTKSNAISRRLIGNAVFQSWLLRSCCSRDGSQPG